MVLERKADRAATAGFKVLIVGESTHGFFGLAQRLEQWGCQCSLVDSQESARRLCLQARFDLALSVDRSSRLEVEFLAALAGTGTDLFRALPVEDSCWWLPVLRQGRECGDGRALRPAEFAQLVQEMAFQSKPRGEAASQPGLPKFAPAEAVAKPGPAPPRKPRPEPRRAR